MQESMGVAIVGCGYVADYYATTLPNHPQLKAVGAYDRDPARASDFSLHHGIPVFASMADLLADESVRIVVNLTNPRSHAHVTRAALEAGRHVYSEKPLALSLPEARELVELAESRGLTLGTGPCTLLGETAQTVWRALRDGAVGRPRLVYAELDDGAIHQMPYWTWTSASGAPWPYLDEFRVGPALEHAAYYLNWLTAFFGPVTEVTSFSALVVPGKVPGMTGCDFAPDFTTAALRFTSGVIARLTCSTLAPEDRALRIIGDDGVLHVAECWDYGAGVTLRTLVPAERRESSDHYLEPPVSFPLVRPADYHHSYKESPEQEPHDMDFARGVAEVADAVIERRGARVSARQALHVLEIILAMTECGTTTIESTFEPVTPMPWAGLPA
ncbi:Gfo/Idh/MocA family protein [Nonomuraea diastatica]|uniref:Gfo/Idh/MocA family oxidoreductase n=1 Tax=Nonomuraea diastatica TaxID=1848329 RepID=A0A4R4WR45_9ACTN|nr:Gfo/Idh/MocA family oxidoreductase [Nonomuraea diastatica]TDD20253.1 Gfo/Idh/MocA family oxidoreductase [Nonomuraea diastatica]